MTVYLSQQNSAAQNLELLAKSAMPVTKEYADALKRKDEQHFFVKDLACKVATVALVALGATAAILFSTPVGIVLGALAIVPIQLSLVVDRAITQADLAVGDASRAINDIAQALSTYIIQKRTEKIAAMFKENGSGFTGNRTELMEQSNHFATLWDKEELGDKYKDAMKEHSRIRLLAEVVLARTFDKDSPMIKVQENLSRFLNGQDGCYLTLQWDIAASRWKTCFI